MAPSMKGIRPWSCEIATFEHRDVLSNVMGLTNQGRNVILGDRRSLILMDLNDSGNIVKTFPRNSKWDITKIAPNNEYVAISSNNSIDLLSNELQFVSHIRKGHQRMITDVNWKSMSDRNLFSTVSLDTDVHLWDVRDTRGPQMTLNGMIGASQCKWNRNNTNILATVHEGDVKLWDIRKKDAPFHYFTAHVSARILSFDWSFTDENEFVTTGHQDQLIKFHYIKKPEHKNSFLKMAVPVWIARHTPFGEGLVTIIIPHMHQNDNSLFLWSMNSLESPIHSFFGHRDVIYDFDWRKCPNNTNNYELVTWSRDRTLRLWQVDRTIQCQCGSEESDDTMEPSGIESHDILKIHEKIDPLKEEFDVLNFNYTNIRLDEMNLKKRLIKLYVKESAILVINFPSKYPNGGSSPTFVFLRNMGNVKCNLSPGIRQRILSALKILAFNLVRSYQPCLEQCMNHLDSILSREFSNSIKPNGDEIINTLDSFPAAESRVTRKKEPVYFEGDGNVPYPRSSGAVFCGNGTLVVFGNKLFSHSGITPRALSAYGAQLKDLLRMDNFENTVVLKTSNKNSEENGKTSSTDLRTNKGRFNVQTIKNVSSGGGDKTSSHQSKSSNAISSNILKRRKMLANQTKVAVYNVSMLFPFSLFFASRYLFNPANNCSVSEICQFNAQIARKANRLDLVRLWMIANQMARLSESNEMNYWEHHPLGRPLLTSIIDHYIKAKDPQTAATLILTFQNDENLSTDSLPHQTHKNRSSNNSVKFYLDVSKDEEKKKNASLTSLESNSSKEISCSSSSNKKFWFLKPGALNSLSSSTSPYHTVSAVTNASSMMKDITLVSKSSLSGETVSNLDLALLNPNKCRSNSWCSSAILSNYNPQNIKKNSSLRLMTPPSRLQLSPSNSSPIFAQNILSETAEEEEDSQRMVLSLLDPKKNELYNKVKRTYGDILYNWGLFSKRSEVLKRCSPYQSEVADVFSSVILEKNVDNEVRIAQKNMSCSLCQLPVKGLASSCLVCGHGGHIQHLIQWFTTPETKCPSGCGCLCQKQSGESIF
uniref:RWD domain-containing protein n=1 Tax=Lepeophtheirus salmonis TaxID=72036 RepID=A0A0K2T6J0_LEPSM